MKIEMSKNFKEADYKVYTTKKYDLFVFNAENREVSPKRVEAIKQSIESVGYIRNPIIVNEKFEIMDGQGRFTVLKNAGMPIEFIVEPGIGADEFRALNMRQTNWTVKDFIHSYSKTKKDYERFSKNNERISDVQCSCYICNNGRFVLHRGWRLVFKYN